MTSNREKFLNAIPEKNDTAVQWLRFKITHLLIEFSDRQVSDGELRNKIKECFDEAEQREREQIEEAFIAYRHNRNHEDAQQYYNETYGK